MSLYYIKGKKISKTDAGELDIDPKMSQSGPACMLKSLFYCRKKVTVHVAPLFSHFCVALYILDLTLVMNRHGVEQSTISQSL